MRLQLPQQPGVQLLLRTGGEAIRLTLEGGGFAAEYYAMRAVPVEYNTGDGTQQGGAMVLEQRPAQKPDYASRLAPFWVYDCMIEAPDGCIRAQDSLAAAYLCLCPDVRCRPGTYTLTLRAQCAEGEYCCALDVRVYGVRVPQDMQVIGFDNVPDAEYCMPGLTTIDPHVDDYARHAVDMLIARIEGSADPFRTYVTSYDLVRRASTC